MAKFLNTSATNYHLEELIKAARTCIYVSCLVLSVASCGRSEKESLAIKSCFKSGSKLDIYNEAGEQISKSEHGQRMLMDVCSAKARLYVKGYRVEIVVDEIDYRLWASSLVSGKDMDSIYIEIAKARNN